MNEQTERQLLEQAQTGNPDAFAVLVERYSSRLFSACLSFLGNRQDAEDCVQEAFIKAFRALGDYNFRSSFYTWIYRIAVNACLDCRRKNRRSQTVSLDEAMETDDSQLYLQIPDRGPRPDDLAEQSETREVIRQEIAGLPEFLRDVLVLRDLEGLSYHELASLLNLTEGTVKSRLSRARRQLMERIRNREQSGARMRLTDNQS